MKQLADEFKRFSKSFSMLNTKGSKAVAVMMKTRRNKTKKKYFKMKKKLLIL